MNADGSGTRKLTHNALQNAEPAWSPDGRKIAFLSRTRRQRGDLRHERRRERKAEPHAEPGEGRPSFLVPDGRKIAFVSDRDGRLEAHVMNADGSGQRSLTVQDR